jgi:hypothetical protein
MEGFEELSWRKDPCHSLTITGRECTHVQGAHRGATHRGRLGLHQHGGLLPGYAARGEETR